MLILGRLHLSRVVKAVVVLLCVVLLLFEGLLEFPASPTSRRQHIEDFQEEIGAFLSSYVNETQRGGNEAFSDVRRKHVDFQRHLEGKLKSHSYWRHLSGPIRHPGDSPGYDGNLSFAIDMLTDLPATKQAKPWGNDITQRCENKTYPTDLSQVSVILTFHENEHLWNILHTIHSILQRTPRRLLKEIILIDDNSKKEELTGFLGSYVESVLPPFVYLLRSRRRLGLIRARLLGARMAHGDVIVCMDSHMEVQHKWLEPLLNEIKLNRRTLAASYLDWMTVEGSSWKYTHGASNWKTYFDWTFNFGFQAIPDYQQEARKDPTKPVRTPVFVGTLFAMDKKYFFEIGAFDEEMEGWGGENLDLPVRVWLCGGRVVNVPCSHAAHYENPGHRLYRITWDDLIHRNYRRVAEVWLDHYKYYFYHYLPEAKNVSVGDIGSRLKLRERCPHDFEWFLKNIYPELGLPDRESFAYGGMYNLASKECFHVSPPQNPRMRECTYNPSKQGVYWSMSGELRYPVHVFNGRVKNWSKGDTHITHHVATEEYVTHHLSGRTSRWIHWKNGPIVDHRTGMCLEHDPSTGLKLETCNVTSPTQQWHFKTYSSHYYQLHKDYGKEMESNVLNGYQFVSILDKFARGRKVR